LTEPTLLAVPNVSEGRDRGTVEKIARGFGDDPRARLLDAHGDPDHNRSVFTLAGRPGSLSEAVLGGALEAVDAIDLGRHTGVHPRVGAIDIAPVVYLREEDIGAACAEALVLGDLLATEAGLPVFLYGALGGGRTRAEIRRGGLGALRERMAAGELRADFGPPAPHATAGAVLVGARGPLIAFNVELAPPATLEDARAIAAAIREGGAEGLPGLRAIGVWLEERGAAQVSMNVEDHRATPLVTVVEAIERHAQLAQAELVGLAPRAALEGFPERVALRGAATIEDALARAPSWRSDND
jgi:glutamate formiminotransferase/glutamate formiminotransferase/formiminotetrahydrofolate cyclodeaminase